AYLEWRPVSARSGNPWYRTRRFARRYRFLVAAATLTIAGLAAGLYIAKRQRMIAEERFSQLHFLAAKVFALDAELRQLPGAIQARQDLVSVSLSYLEKLGASAHGDLNLSQEIAAEYMRLARTQGSPAELNLGDFANAEKSLQKGDQFIDSVLASRPNSPDA